MKYKVITRTRASLIDATVKRKSEGVYMINWFDVQTPHQIHIQEEFDLDEFNWDQDQLKVFKKMPARDKLQIIRFEKLIDTALNFLNLSMHEEGESTLEIKARTLFKYILTLIESDDFRKKITASAQVYIEELIRSHNYIIRDN